MAENVAATVARSCQPMQHCLPAEYLRDSQLPRVKALAGRRRWEGPVVVSSVLRRLGVRSSTPCRALTLAWFPQILPWTHSIVASSTSMEDMMLMDLEMG